MRRQTSLQWIFPKCTTHTNQSRWSNSTTGNSKICIFDFGVCRPFNSCQVLIHCWSSCSCMLNPSVPLYAGERLAQLVFRSENSASLWSLKAIHAMCEVEQSRVRFDPLSPPSHLCSSAFRFISSSLLVITFSPISPLFLFNALRFNPNLNAWLKLKTLYVHCLI